MAINFLSSIARHMKCSVQLTVSLGNEMLEFHGKAASTYSSSLVSEIEQLAGTVATCLTKMDIHQHPMSHTISYILQVVQEKDILAARL